MSRKLEIPEYLKEYTDDPYHSIAIVPENVISQLEEIIANLEKNSETKFQITIRESTKNSTLTVGAFNKRKGYVIYDMLSKKEFIERHGERMSGYTKLKGFSKLNKLEGTYSDMKEIKEKVKNLRFKTVEENDVKGWKCGKCKTINTAFYNSLCQAKDCHYEHRNIWGELGFYPSSNAIYVGGGGSYSELFEIGKIRIK